MQNRHGRLRRSVKQQKRRMFRLSNETKAKRGKPYDKANLLRAFEATKGGTSVYRASRMYSVPESTLRDRTRGKQPLDAHMGPERIFTNLEESKMVEHISYMADIGYGYSKGNIQFMAADFARSLGKTVRAKDGLSDHWFYGFLKRWPDMKMVKPQKLHTARAKGANKETIIKYFMELETVLKENDLFNAPERIYNVDETGISTEHSPPKIVCSKNTDPQAITSPRSANVTIIAGANALGNHIPPFYVFPGKRWTDELLAGAPVGSDGMMSDSGWSNGKIFEKYVMGHFAKHAGIKQGNVCEPTLLLYDGHRSHLLLTLTEWASRRRVILFVLPPHTSHLTQPLDVGVFGPLKCHYYRECQSYLHQNPGINITRYEVAKLTSRPYLKALCPENIMSGFRKSGIYPFNSQVFSSSQLAPAVIYHSETPETPNVPEISQELPVFKPRNDLTPNSNALTRDSPIPPSHTNSSIPLTPSVIQPTNECTKDKIEAFFDAKKITKAVKKPKKKFVPPFLVTGSLMKKTNKDYLETQSNKKTSQSFKQDGKIKKTRTITSKQVTSKTVEKSKPRVTQKSPQPSTSGVSSKKGGPIDLNTPEDTCSSDESVAEEDKCCVCNLFYPKEARDCYNLIFIKWAQCDSCFHWTHLQYCSKVRFLRRGDTFLCPHCMDA